LKMSGWSDRRLTTRAVKAAASVMSATRSSADPDHSPQLPFVQGIERQMPSWNLSAFEKPIATALATFNKRETTRSPSRNGGAPPAGPAADGPLTSIVPGHIELP